MVSVSEDSMPNMIVDLMARAHQLHMRAFTHWATFRYKSWPRACKPFCALQ
jgi:hypothetical protein